MTNGTTADRTTSDALLLELRRAVGDDALAFAGPPTALSGGFFAELLRFRLEGAPPGLDGDLVARIVPDAAVGAREAIIQREVADQGFSTPAVRLALDATGPLGRSVIVMDHVDGVPAMAGLSGPGVIGRFPNLVRHLPVQLATLAAALHRLDAAPLTDELAALDGTVAPTVAAFVAQQRAAAEALGRADLVAGADRLLATEPANPVRVITHGDLHPFNVLITAAGPVLIDWTVTGVAQPGFTLGFTALVLAHPPLALPRLGTAALAPVGRTMARRFLASYREQVPERLQVPAAELAWHRAVHALRILVDLAAWDAAGARPVGHPWLVLEPVVTRLLAEHPA